MTPASFAAAFAVGLVLAILLGSTWLGVLGTVLAVPMAAGLAVVLDEVRRAVAAASPSIVSVDQSTAAEQGRPEPDGPRPVRSEARL